MSQAMEAIMHFFAGNSAESAVNQLIRMQWEYCRIIL